METVDQSRRNEIKNIVFLHLPFISSITPHRCIYLKRAFCNNILHKTTFNTPIIIVGQLTLPPFKPDFPAHMDLAGNSNRCCVVSILESERRVVTVLTALFAVCCDVIPTTIIIGYATGNKSKLILHGLEFFTEFHLLCGCHLS